ncbi:MAG: tetratricopeptide repeat protein [Acidobacteriota bacterium]
MKLAKASLCVSLVLGLRVVNAAQIQRGANHILFGDLKIEGEEPAAVHRPAFRVLLQNVSGQILREQTVAVGGRYRFLEVPNGEYILVVEAGNHQMVRIPLLINEFKSTDLRRDLELVWGRGEEHSRNEGGAKLPTHVYARAKSRQDLYHNAQQEIQRGNSRRAASFLEKVVEGDPGDFEAWTELGTARFRSKEFEKAETAYLRALEAKSDYLLALLNLGKLRMARRNFEGAVQSLTQATQLDPGRAEAFYFLGEAHLQIRKGSRAVECFNRALALDPVGMAEAHLRMARLYRAAGYPALVVREYERFLARQPHAPQRKKLEEYIAEHKKP